MEWKRKGPNPDPETRPEPATLVVRVESAFAVELQHLAPVVIERVNAYYGWRCLGRLVLKQGPVRRPEPKRPAAAAVSDADRRKLEQAVSSIAENNLKAALERLGEAVIGSRRRPAPTKE